ILVNPLAWMLTVNIAQSVYGVNYLFNGNNEMGLSSENDVTAVSAYLNAHTNANNLVLASAQILWAIPNFRQTDWGITAAVNNQSGLMERTLYDCSLPAVRFAVVDSLALGFVRNLDPAMKEIVDQVQLWPLVFKSGDLNVHQNPVELYIQ
ncbi:MAG: hypothetical protein WCG34_13205, partial [Leptolinea sp.]